MSHLVDLCSCCEPSGAELLLSHLVLPEVQLLLQCWAVVVTPCSPEVQVPFQCCPLAQFAAFLSDGSAHGCLLSTAGLTHVCWGLSLALQPLQAALAGSRAQLLPKLLRTGAARSWLRVCRQQPSASSPQWVFGQWSFKKWFAVGTGEWQD